jgi:hypothetical protein
MIVEPNVTQIYIYNLFIFFDWAFMTTIFLNY